MPKLVLYHLDYCPFCRKVRNYLQEENISVEQKDTGEDQQALDELISKTGKTQVPCLFIDGEPLFESDDIIQWFQKNYTTR